MIVFFTKKDYTDRKENRKQKRQGSLVGLTVDDLSESLQEVNPKQ